MKTRLRVVVLSDHPDGYDEETELFSALEGAGFRVEVGDWKCSDVAVVEDAIVLVRTPWDYQDQLFKFLAFIARVDQNNIVLNPPGLIRWNATKTYLFDLEARGIEIVPTLYAPKVDGQVLSQAREFFKGRALIVKRCVGAGAQGMIRVEASRDLNTFDDVGLTERFGSGGALLQAYEETFARDGEWSLIYFGTELVSSVLKMTTGGEYRVQRRYGGFEEARTPPGKVIQLADRCLRALSQLPLYARVDIVAPREGGARLVELELIEPRLFWEHAPGLAEKFAAHLKAYLGDNHIV